MDKYSSGFTEEEILEISEYDEEWGHLRTTLHPRSMKSSELLERIEKDSKHETFHHYTYSLQTPIGLVFMMIVITIILLAKILGGLVPQVSLAEISLFLFSVLALYSLCLYGLYYIEKRTNSIIVNDLGIGWKQFGIAIEWSHVEWIDIGLKEGLIERIIFSEIEEAYGMIMIG
ncbi:MAG: hypothetical protein EAX81_07770 [Candidatus Thorarchaeota archaeon]|nr:hypothetical protein [Candidatus Thorarchaeota archaeon]